MQAISGLDVQQPRQIPARFQLGHAGDSVGSAAGSPHAGSSQARYFRQTRDVPASRPSHPAPQPRPLQSYPIAYPQPAGPGQTASSPYGKKTSHHAGKPATLPKAATPRSPIWLATDQAIPHVNVEAGARAHVDAWMQADAKASLQADVRAWLQAQTDRVTACFCYRFVVRKLIIVLRYVSCITLIMRNI